MKTLSRIAFGDVWPDEDDMKFRIAIVALEREPKLMSENWKKVRDRFLRELEVSELTEVIFEAERFWQFLKRDRDIRDPDYYFDLVIVASEILIRRNYSLFTQNHCKELIIQTLLRRLDQRGSYLRVLDCFIKAQQMMGAASDDIDIIDAAFVRIRSMIADKVARIRSVTSTGFDRLSQERKDDLQDSVLDVAGYACIAALIGPLLATRE